MAKIGKILAPVVAVFAIAVLAMIFFVAKQGKLFRERSQILAEGLSKTATTLDSGSGDKSKADFTKSDNGSPEGGKLGWAQFKENPDNYASSANSVDGLAKKVIGQRDYIIDKLVEASTALETPAAYAPNADELANVTQYDAAADKFANYIKDRVARDKNIASNINSFAGKLGVRDTFGGEVQEGGRLSSTDAKVFRGMEERVGNLKNSYKAYQTVFKNISTGLASLKLEQGTLRSANANAPALTNSGMEAQDARAVTDLVSNLTADLNTIRGQLERIPQLKSELEAANAEIKRQEALVVEWQKKYAEDEEVIQSYYKQGLGMSSATNDKVLKESFEEMRKDLSGEVLQADAEYGYIIVNLTNCDVIQGVNLSVHRLADGKYLGVVKVLKAGEFNSITTMVVGDIRDIAVGDKVVVGSTAIQDF